MNKVWLVMRREYLFNLRRPAFLLSAFLGPVFTILLMAVVFSVTISATEGGNSMEAVGYIDQAGIVADAATVPDYFTLYSDEESARADLEAGTLAAYLVIPPTYTADGRVTLYHTEALPSGLRDDIDAMLLANLTATADDLRIAERLGSPMAELLVQPQDTGRVIGEDSIWRYSWSRSSSPSSSSWPRRPPAAI